MDANRASNRKPDKIRIYILPTRFGFVFLAGALVMILIGSAYQNNLVNMLAFFMLSLVFICMIQTHMNLKDVRVREVESEGGFQGAEFLVTTVLTNEAKATRFNLETRLRKIKARAHYENHQALGDRGTLKLRATYPAEKRGVFTLRGARLSSVYPLGLFEAWTWFNDVETRYFVYPELKGDRPFPAGSLDAGSGLIMRSRGGDDFHGHRKFNDGDSFRHVDWKARARGRPLLVKEFSEGAPGTTIFDWHSLGTLDAETRLSQLAKWVEEAKNKKALFALRLPDEFIPPGQGLLHAQRCWRSLAAYEPAPADHRRDRSG